MQLISMARHHSYMPVMEAKLRFEYIHISMNEIMMYMINYISWYSEI